MFVLAEMRNSVRVTPDKFDRSMADACIGHLEKVLVGKVIKNVGLCMALFDVLKIEDSFLLPGDGAAHTTVTFRAAVFRPFLEEILIGKVKRCSPSGVQVTLGFFDDIVIPPHNLQQPARYDEAEGTWVWEYQADEETKHDLFMDMGEPIRFRVIRNEFFETNAADVHTQKTQESVDSPTSPYKVTGDVNEPGLGLISWWS